MAVHPSFHSLITVRFMKVFFHKIFIIISLYSQAFKWQLRYFCTFWFWLNLYIRHLVIFELETPNISTWWKLSWTSNIMVNTKIRKFVLRLKRNLWVHLRCCKQTSLILCIIYHPRMGWTWLCLKVRTSCSPSIQTDWQKRNFIHQKYF